jgi:hypothetical protein
LANRYLLGACARQRHGRALRHDALVERRQPRPGHFVRGRRGVELLLGHDAFLRHALRALQVHARVLELGGRGSLVRLDRGQARLRLGDLLGHLPLLEAQRGFALPDLRAGAFGVRRVESLVLAQFVWRDDRDHLVGLHRLALIDEKLADAPHDLGADDDFVGGDDAGEDERLRQALAVGVIPGPAQ